MSIEIDPDTQKAVDPESIGKGMFKRFLLAVAVIAVFALAWKLL